MVCRPVSAIPRSALAALAVLPWLTGCAGLPELPRWPSLAALRPALAERAPAPEAARYAFFGKPYPGDPWSVAIAHWRLRERAALRVGLIAPFPVEPAPLPDVSAPPAARGGAPDDFALGARYDAFLAEQRRQIASEVLAWVQALSRERFLEDGPVDHWPTLAEVLASVGDDCDGLELMAYHALRQLGFPAGQVYRAVVARPDTGQHHMVTLWFEDPQDPWVLDPTDAITSRLRKLSALPAWVPLKLFSEDAEFTVTRLDADAVPAAPEPALQEPVASE